MPMMAAAFPIVPGKTAEWRAWTAELNGPRREEFEASRRRVGVHERTYLQSTPMGDLVIVTIEGDDPGRSFAELASADDEFTKWFIAKASEFHGFDMSQLPAGDPSELVIDSDRSAVAAG
jgi:hypothetical protein